MYQNPFALHRRSRLLHIESLEARLPMSISPLSSSTNASVGNDAAMSITTGEKPQSKVWEHDGAWFSVMSDNAGTWVRRLDGNQWTPLLRLTTDTKVHADVKPDGDLAHVLLFDGIQSQLATVEFVGGSLPTYQLWTLQPHLVDVVLSEGVETATIDLDSTGRMWLASDAKTTVEVRYSDFPYTNFSAPVTIASAIGKDDICAIAAMPSGQMGVMWSDQNHRVFGFRTHADNAEATVWSTTELFKDPSTKKTKGGVADDHIHLAVAQDGTVYAAVKTSYDTRGLTQIGLLVRRPTGKWDSLYTVDTAGTRPIVVLNESTQRLLVIYTKATSGGDIVYRESPLGSIVFGPRKTLLKGKLNDATSTKQAFSEELVVMATGAKSVTTVKLRMPTNPVASLNSLPLKAGKVANQIA